MVSAAIDDTTTGPRQALVEVRFAPGPSRRWTHWLVARLATLGRVRVAAASYPGPPAARHRSLSALDALERMIFRIHGDRASDWVSSAPLLERYGSTEGNAEFVIDLTGCATTMPEEAGRRLQPCFDGAPDEDRLIGRLLDRQLPWLSIEDSGPPGAYQVGLVAVERPDVLCLAMDGVLSRVGLALVDHVSRVLAGAHLEADRSALQVPAPLSSPSAAKAALLGVRTIAAKVMERIDRLLGRAPTWAFAWRRYDAPQPTSSAIIAGSELTLFRDDGKRYFGDPFGFTHEGADWVFVEELPFATGKGIISAARLEPDGTMATPRPVLELPCHLSYPQILTFDGQIWMMPESSANRTIEIHRAVAFPGRWERHATLIEGSFHDATMFAHGGAWWITAAEADWQASTWDTLAVFRAAHPLGPWHRVGHGAVLTDVRSARPAGTPFVVDGRLVRPAQDCTGGYGSALTLAEVTRLDATGFTQRSLGRITFDEASGFSGPHTLNQIGRWQLLDMFGRLPPA